MKAKDATAAADLLFKLKCGITKPLADHCFRASLLIWGEERKTLDRELARAKVTANRVATVVANEWKDANDKVMPVNQWLEERKFLQGEMQQLRNKLTITERAPRSETQLKEKFQLRLRLLEHTLRSPNPINRISSSDGKSMNNGP
ncbi:Myosin II heavy chain-like protein [Artemisia annua]|uniref:Myosin II heavy chain-like protein n=1 Tax=Artemisia annua TaxID=35608 RepID=A0A2U1NY25_ARTAN|nr:Myosin II heavy chain-like protein [Artemisia annua]